MLIAACEGSFLEFPPPSQLSPVGGRSRAPSPSGGGQGGAGFSKNLRSHTSSLSEQLPRKVEETVFPCAPVRGGLRAPGRKLDYPIIRSDSLWRTGASRYPDGKERFLRGRNPPGPARSRGKPGFSHAPTTGAPVRRRPEMPDQGQNESALLRRSLHRARRRAPPGRRADDRGRYRC